MQSLVTSDWLYANLENEDLIVLDCSPVKNVSGLTAPYPGRIKGARIFDFKNVFSDPEQLIPNMAPSPEAFEKGCKSLGINHDSTVVIYDNLGIYTSPRAYWMFKLMGHSKVAVLDGGFPSWYESEYPIELNSDTASYVEGNFVSNYCEDRVMSSKQMKENLKTKKAIVIDARSSGRFNGTAPEPRPDLKSGHIPGSYNLPFKNLLNAYKFKPTEELRQLTKDIVQPNQPIVFTCGSGITACILLLAIEQVHPNPLAVYDGSWSEWGLFDSHLIEV